MLPKPMLPECVGRLDELANNLWWSWHPQARDLFRALDYQLWRMSGHNPVRQLREVSADRIQEAAGDTRFLALYDAVMSSFDADMLGERSWVATQHPELRSRPVAYFSAEFAIHNSLPIYAGGLGILAGDLCKEACDLGLPLVAVGFMYPQGYFHQHISAEGWQEEIYRQLDFAEAPVNPVLSPQGRRLLVPIPIDSRALYVGVWRVRLGPVDLYLLDTQVEENAPPDRELAARLYITDREQRIQQEILLGIGGVRVLRALGIEPSVWHANEGHTSFMMLERLREKLERGAPFDQAVEEVRATTVFTTHTPVPAGHDVFSADLVARYFSRYCESLCLERQRLLELGRHGDGDGQSFNMTALGLKLSGYRNAVSRLHGEVTRRMWHGLWPDLPEDQVPISHVTNGVHVLTWIAPEVSRLYEKYLGSDLVQKYDDTQVARGVLDIPDEELWGVRQVLKRKLARAILERAQERWASGEVSAEQVLAMGALLDPEVLTIGFVRRFTEYKRPALIFRDIERLKRIVKDRWRPVQIVFAGKSHPADALSKILLQRVYTVAKDCDFQGRIVFVEDYDMHMARYLVQGVDVWLNTPRRLQEASGTSGMKAGVNGVLHLSICDGWWHEGYNGANGWVIGDHPEITGPEAEDGSDAEALYRLLEEEIVPLYYDRDRGGVPHRWIAVVKEAIRSIVPVFSARRMLKEYTESMYVPAARSLGDQGRD